MNLNVSIKRPECSSHLEGGVRNEDGAFALSPAEPWRLDRSGVSHAMSHLDRREFGPRRSGTRDATGPPDISWHERQHLVDSRQTWKATKEQREETFLRLVTSPAELQQRILLWFQTSLVFLLSPSIPLYKHKLWLKALCYFLLLSFHISSEFSDKRWLHQSRLTFKVTLRFPLRAKDFGCLLLSLEPKYTHPPPAHIASCIFWVRLWHQCWGLATQWHHGTSASLANHPPC